MGGYETSRKDPTGDVSYEEETVGQYNPSPSHDLSFVLQVLPGGRWRNERQGQRRWGRYRDRSVPVKWGCSRHLGRRSKKS